MENPKPSVCWVCHVLPARNLLLMHSPHVDCASDGFCHILRNKAFPIPAFRLMQSSSPEFESCTRCILRGGACPKMHRGPAWERKRRFARGRGQLMMQLDIFSVGWTVSFNGTRFHLFLVHEGHILCRPRRPGPRKATAPEVGHNSRLI